MKKSTTKKTAPKVYKRPIATPMTKATLLSEIAVNAGITKAQAEAFYASFLAIAYAGARKADGIVLPGLVKLIIRDQHTTRATRNPRTSTMSSRGRVVIVKPLKVFSDAVLGIG